MKVKVNGQDFPVPATPKVKPKVKRDKQGKVLEIKGLEELAQGGFDPSRFASTSSAMFPAKDLNVGDTWTVKPEEGSPLPMDFAGKLLALEKVNGRDCAKVEMKITADMAKLSDVLPTEIMGMKFKFGGTVKTTMILYIALESGWVIKGDGTADLDMTIDVENMFKIHQKMKMKMEMKEDKSA